jgi:FMN-dependent NADH-azoreductase
MHNFGIPSSLKAWIDHIVRVGRTFRYSASGLQGLVPSEKKVIVASVRGGVLLRRPNEGPRLPGNVPQTILGFNRMKDISFVRAEGVGSGRPEFIDAAMQAAQVQLAAAVQNAV